MSVEIDVGGSKISAGKLVFVVAMFGIAGWVLFKPAPPDLTRCQKIPDFDVARMNPEIGPITDAVYVNSNWHNPDYPLIDPYVYGYLSEKTDVQLVYIRTNPNLSELGGGGHGPLDSETHAAGQYGHILAGETIVLRGIDNSVDGAEEVRLCLASGKFKVE